MTFDFNTIPLNDKITIKNFCRLCVEQSVNLENTKKNGYYKMRAIFILNPYLTMFFNKFQIALGKEDYTLVWPEESMPKLLKLGKEVQMYEKLQEIKKDF